MITLAAAAFAARLTVDLEADRVEVGQSTRLVLQIVDGQPTSLPQVDAPAGLTVKYLGQSERVLRGTQGLRLLEHGWRVEAVVEGAWTLGPMVVQLADGPHELSPLTLEVVPAVPKDERPIAEAEAELLPESAWEGQVVVYRYSLRSRAPILRSRWTLPPMAGLLPPRDGDVPRSEHQLEGPDGVLFVDTTWLPLVATKSGDLGQKMAVVDVELGSVGGHGPVRDVLPAGSARLVVAPLPEAPPGFSGVVGDVTVTSGLGDGPVAVGQGLAWTLWVRGDGALDSLVFPALPQGSPWSAYDATPVASARVIAGRYEAEVELGRTLVPSAPGSLVVPDLSLIVFSPTQGAYVTHTVPGGTIEVVGSAGGGAVESFGGRDAAAPDGPRPLVASGAHLDVPGGWPVWWAIALAPGALVLVIRALPRRAAAVSPVDDPLGERSLCAALGVDPADRAARASALVGVEPARRGRFEAAFAAVDAARFGNGDPERARQAVRAALEAPS